MGKQADAVSEVMIELADEGFIQDRLRLVKQLLRVLSWFDNSLDMFKHVHDQVPCGLLIITRFCHGNCPAVVREVTAKCRA